MSADGPARWLVHARRSFATTIVAVFAGVALLSGAATAQPESGRARIGYLSPASAAGDARNRDAFVSAMRKLGYVEGRNLQFEARYADGHLDRLGDLAAELRRENVDVLVAATTLAVRAAQQAAPTTPVVMAFAGDPVGDGLVASLARPGGLTTGLSAAVTEIAAKRVELLKAVLPRATHFVLLAVPGASASMVAASERAGAALGLQVTTLRVTEGADVAAALDRLRKDPVDGIIVDLAIRGSTAQILASARALRLATISGPREFAAAGGLLSLGANYADLYRRAATYVDRILRGARPGDLPVEQSSEFELVVNAGTARALGLTLPGDVLARANEIIP